MKTKGRAKSKNVVDRRNEKWKNGVYSFLLDSFSSANSFKAKDYNKFKKAK
jgi:hypothetical protein